MVIRGIKDLEFVRKLENSITYATKIRLEKNDLKKQGYKWGMSLYGALYNKETMTNRYIRIEVLSNTPFTERLVELIYRHLYNYTPVFTYSVFAYTKERDGLLLVDGSD